MLCDFFKVLQKRDEWWGFAKEKREKNVGEKWRMLGSAKEREMKREMNGGLVVEKRDEMTN